MSTKILACGFGPAVVALFQVAPAVAADELARLVSLDVEPTVLYVERDGALRRVVSLNVSFEAGGCAGGDAVPRSDITAGGHTCIMGRPAFGQDAQVAGWQVFCTQPGPIQLRIFRRDGSSIVQAAQSSTEHMKPGFNRFTLPAPIPAKKGDLVGFYAGPGASVAEDPDGGDFYFLPGDVEEKRSSALIWRRSKAVSSVQAFDEAAKSALDRLSDVLRRARVTARCGAETQTLGWEQLESEGSTRFLDVPAVDGPMPVTITLKSDQLEWARAITVQPEQKWKVYLFHSLHIDIGYTNCQEVVARRLVENLDTVMDFYREGPAWLADLGPVWNCEVAWVIDEYRRRRSSEQFERLISFVKNGRLSAQALFCNTLSGLYGPEELVRLLYFTAGLKRDYGVLIRSAMQTDTPNYTYALPSILAGAGIRYLSVGQNGGVPFRRPQVNPFYWVGPDGSEVLVWHSQGYGQSADAGSSRRLIQERIRAARLESGICDALGCHGLYGDNAVIDLNDYRSRLEVVKAWNRRWAYPRLIVGTPYDLLRYLEEQFGPKLPRLRGDWGCDWEDGAASSSRETGVNRRAKNLLAAAETLAAVVFATGEDYRYPKKQIDETFRNAMLYDEHTWGASESISRPESDQTRGQWSVKSGYATEGLESARSIAESALAALGARVPTGEATTILVYNPLSWQRTDVAVAALPESWRQDVQPLQVIDSATGRAVPSERRGGDLVFLARDVPSVGYKTFPLQKGGLQADSSIRIDALTIENRFFKVALDPNSGAVASIFDKQLNWELVDTKSPYRCNQYVYDNLGVSGMAWRRSGKEGGGRQGPKNASIKPGANGPVCGSIISTASGLMAPRIEQEIILYPDLKRIDLVNRLRKDLTYDVERVYYAFPFAVGKPDFVCELGGSIISALRDRFDCADRNWFAIQNWVDVSNGQCGVTWASREAPLVSLVEIPDKWVEKVVPANGSLFSYIMNNVWCTNYKAGQGGDFTFRYAIRSHRGGVDKARATRFGAELANPLLCRVVPANQGGSLPPDRCSFCGLDSDGVVLQCLKRAEDGRGLIARVREVRGRDTTVHLSLSSFVFKQAARTNLVEEDLETIEPNGSILTIPVRGGGMSTVRCW